MKPNVRPKATGQWTITGTYEGLEATRFDLIVAESQFKNVATLLRGITKERLEKSGFRL